MNIPRQLREEILSRRDRLSPRQIEEKSERIQHRLLEQIEIEHAHTVFTYVSFRSEVRTAKIIAELLQSGRQVAVPVTRVKEKRLEIVAITNPDSDLVPGYCGIPEPRDECIRDHRLTPGDIDVIILPGSVFDRRCGRFGYGGGYYDRLLAQIPAAKRIALAFEMQIVDRLPLQDHDEILDKIISEEQTLSNSLRKR
ncbi:MAG: 5-formyltetrahydrofolate cyclo-ligase [Desulfocapsaceae bacterium]|jgi:5-formyltetrahydrofolate cyclo-ligase|nr:5-formyltetrahydrofolate cyclo-ligase [Desulfocapsaceae bacterium]